MPPSSSEHETATTLDNTATPLAIGASQSLQTTQIIKVRCQAKGEDWERFSATNALRAEQFEPQWVLEQAFAGQPDGAYLLETTVTVTYKVLDILCDDQTAEQTAEQAPFPRLIAPNPPTEPTAVPKYAPKLCRKSSVSRQS